MAVAALIAFIVAARPAVAAEVKACSLITPDDVAAIGTGFGKGTPSAGGTSCEFTGDELGYFSISVDTYPSKAKAKKAFRAIVDNTVANTDTGATPEVVSLSFGSEAEYIGITYVTVGEGPGSYNASDDSIVMRQGERVVKMGGGAGDPPVDDRAGLEQIAKAVLSKLKLKA